MEHRGALSAAAGISPDRLTTADLGHVQLAWFDRIRALLVRTGLPPLPEVYDLFWRYVGSADFHLCQALETALIEGSLDLATVLALRQRFCNEVTAGDVSALVQAAHVQATRMTERLTESRTDLAEYGRTIADSNAALNNGRRPTTAALAELIERLAAATGAMLVANRRLEVELTAAAAEAAQLRDRLKRAERASVTDPLTGLLNRRGVTELLETARARSRGAAAALSVALIDIDHFKRVNDRWGHVIGDEVLRHVAHHLAEGVGACGTVGRLGGEEFVAVLPGLDERASAVLIDTVRAGLARRAIRRIDGTNLGHVTFSAGIARDCDDETAESLIARADAALYAAKRLGRDRVIPDRG